METTIKRPDHFKPLPSRETLATNLDNQIDVEVEKAIKNQPYYAEYTAWHFIAYIWWHDPLGYWCGEVWVNRQHVTSYIAEKPEDLINEINLAHGKGEKPWFTI